MEDGKLLKVLLYFDGSRHSFSAAVYTANLFNRIPNMSLTVLHVRENVEGSKQEEYNLMEIWSTDLNSDWAKSLLEKVDVDKRSQYSEIIAKTNQIFSERGHNVNQQIIFANANIPDTVDAIIDYATNKGFELIIMGTRGLTSLKGLIYGSLAHSVLNKSDIPVLLIKKLPQEFVDGFCSSSSGKSSSPRTKERSDHLHLAKSI
ncbi:universal stress protein [Desulfosporosinus sp. BICA1-9]|uniref:universal stress protein n=1 Tax=Desulfosporosinus sp. BICA1-9 TaxID=1531958 RepID=UPI00054C05DB|nr:universal stress protein [Desulfosporosinus sp. BICA1-9]KJS49719.1 MAG: universal stress protein [Peptococcaceae bacterium BRH_c23]KJS88301.1 MAG: universal stress protein [Desulfosporosinus sp. BICA1-9]HBW35972.1 universal stress protein [Desulfosporosinus sp.]